MAVPPEKWKSPRQRMGPMTRNRRDRPWWTEPTRGQVRVVPAPRVDVAGTLWCLHLQVAMPGLGTPGQRVKPHLRCVCEGVSGRDSQLNPSVRRWPFSVGASWSCEDPNGTERLRG